MMSADGVTRGLMTVSYDRDEYRPTIRVDGQNVWYGLEVGTMRQAIRASNTLAIAWKEARHG